MTTVVTSRVEKWLQVSIVLLTTLGTTLLGSSQGNLGLPMLLLFAGVTSVVFTDRLGWFRLPRILANVLMLLLAFYWLCVFFGSDAGMLELFKVIVTSGYPSELLRGGTDSFQRLLAIASLLAYVQVVMLYQKKTLRIYGHLAIFSLLQVVIASLLSTSFGFGIALVFYIFTALFTLSLFYIFRQGKQVQLGHYRARRRAERDWKRQQEHAPTEDAGRLAILAGTSPVSSADRKISSTTASILGWGFTRQLLAIGLGTVVFSMTFFFCMPRSGSSSWQQPGFGRYKQVGFRRDVQLSDVGKLLQSQEIALRVSFTDLKTGEPYRVYGEPYLRGAVLNRYDSDSGHWSAMDPPQDLENKKLPDLPPRASRDLVQQEFLLELNDDPALMAVFPAYQLPETDQHVSYDPVTSQIYLNRSRRSPVVNQYRYVLATDAFQGGGVQSELQLILLRSGQEEELFQEELEEMTSLPFNLWPLKQFTAEYLEQENVPKENRVLTCRTLEQFLKSDAFRYTLDLNVIQPMRQMGRDQVEDFLLNHRTGNCEYFASALVLMLRSQGIPARMAIGFRGGELNRTGNYFTVHQYNAHAWVEAFLSPQVLSPSLVEEIDQDALWGAWLRLDPTPIIRPDEEPTERTLTDRIVDSFDYMQLLWDNNVLRLNAQQQRQAVFDRLGWDPQQGFRGITSLPVIRWFHVDFSRGLWTGILSWNFLAWLILLPLLGWLVYQLRRRLADRQRGSGQKPVSRRQILQKAQCEFFLRFEQLLQEHGFLREPCQTQQEFIREIEKQLVGGVEDFSVRQLLNRMVETYYRVRFGNRLLNEDQQRQVRGQIDQLAAALTPTVGSG
jgi:transglutaminase-like putative cysteine protease